MPLCKERASNSEGAQTMLAATDAAFEAALSQQTSAPNGWPVAQNRGRKFDVHVHCRRRGG